MTPIHIEAWPGLVHVYRIVREQDQDPLVDTTPIDAVVGFYRFEAVDADGLSTLYGFRWMGRSLPDYAAFAAADPDWAHWVPKDVWDRLQAAWQTRRPFREEVVRDTP